MNAFFNQYSYLLISLAILFGIGWLLYRTRLRSSYKISLFLGLMVALASLWVTLRPSNTDVQSVSQAEEMIANGKPTFIQFYSQYCLGCVAIQPEVDKLIAEIHDDLNVLRIDIHSQHGSVLSERYTFQFSPEFILLDSAGNESWRGHTLPDTQTLQSLS